jgi:CheY-like chemotaxis protein
MNLGSAVAASETSPEADFVLAPEHEALTILYIEDNPGDVTLVREALVGVNSVKLWSAPDGVTALRLLEGPGKRPDLILLDLNLPRMDGRELLGRLKSTPELCCIPVIVLTSSEAYQDVKLAYVAHANCFVAKPREFAGFEKVVRRLVEFWGETAILPGDH